MNKCKLEQFLQFDEKYRSCCGSLHIKTGARMVGVIMLLIRLGVSFLKFSDGVSAVKENASIMILTIDIILPGLMMFGIAREKRYFIEQRVLPIHSNIYE